LCDAAAMAVCLKVHCSRTGPGTAPSGSPIGWTLGSCRSRNMQTGFWGRLTSWKTRSYKGFSRRPCPFSAGRSERTKEHGLGRQDANKRAPVLVDHGGGPGCLPRSRARGCSVTCRPPGPKSAMFPPDDRCRCSRCCSSCVTQCRYDPLMFCGQASA